jgi:hypothetical protein
MARGGGRINLARASAATTTFDPMSLSFGISNGKRQVDETITVTVTNLSGSARTLTLSESDPALTLSATSVPLGANGTATFGVTLKARGQASGEGDVTVSDGTTTFLIPFWYSTGN